MRNKTFKIGFAVGVIAGFIALLGAAFVWFSGGTAQASVAVTAPALQAMLIGQPKTVVGKTNQVAGEMIVDFQNPAKSQLGAIRINVRTLTTDNEFRNRALRGQILQSTKPEFEFATFVPTELKGLPAAFAIGQSYSFQIVGKLTLRDVTRDVTFDATVKPISSEQLTGTASIPEAPGVADIAENVRLEIDFTAIPASAHE
jgi:polyisoprenoid-binding protein YceI